MTRVAGPILAALGLALAATTAIAADYNGRGARSSGGVAAVGVKCRGPVVETARFKEQVCHKGVAGYAYCRWIEREHDVATPEHCTPAYTRENAYPADRGAFPPYPRG